MTLELRVESGARAGTVERFEKSVISIGRHPLSDLRFDPQADLDVSGRHAELRGVDGVWTLHDEQSTNGTFVNGTRVDGTRVVKDGDRITFGAHGPLVQVRVIEGVVATPRATAPAHVTPVLPLGAVTPSTDPKREKEAPPRPTAPQRRDTTARVAEAVAEQTAMMRRVVVGAMVVVVVVAAVGFMWWGRQTQARDRELVALIARNDSVSIAFEHAVSELRTRDPAFARELALRMSEQRRAVATSQSLAAEGFDPKAANVQRFSEQVRENTRVQQSIAQMDLAGVHDRNDAAVAMIASDLDGSFIAGTAFGVTANGLLVTNRHVVRTPEGAAPRRIRVIYANTTAWLPAHLVRTAADDDLALIQIDVPGTYPVVAGVSRLGESARVGAPVLSIGYPHAVDTPMKGHGLDVTAATTTAAGTVSKRLDDVLQIDSYAGKGSSGSPVFDAASNVVGVIYGGAPESGGRIVYAVPAQRLAGFLSGQTTILRD